MLALFFTICGSVPAALAGDEEGEFSIPAVMPLDEPRLEALRELVRSDEEAAAVVASLERGVASSLDAEPHPLREIHYEGLVTTDPRRVVSVQSLREMVAVAQVLRYWQATGDRRAAAMLRRFITAWAATYQVTGNDVNENKLYPLLVAYHAVRDGFNERTRGDVDAWVQRLGEHHLEAVRESDHLTNRYTKHLRLLAICAGVLDRGEWDGAVEAGVKRFVSQSLRGDGSSLDLERRDSLGYHTSALRPLVELAMLAGEGGGELYRWESPDGASIQKSVNYVVPYAMGEKTHEEWVHTTVQLDRDRAAAGLEKYRPGRLYDPRDAVRLMEEASYFDPDLLRVVRHLRGSEAERFDSWQALVNEAAGAVGEVGEAGK